MADLDHGRLLILFIFSLFPQLGQVVGKEVPYGTLDGKLDSDEPVSEAVLPLGLHPSSPQSHQPVFCGMGKGL